MIDCHMSEHAARRMPLVRARAYAAAATERAAAMLPFGGLERTSLGYVGQERLRIHRQLTSHL